jgi:OmpR-family two-component system manganese-sensing response regulator
VSRVLIIEDERKLLRSLERGLLAEGFDVSTAATGEAGLEQASGGSFDCLVLDWMLPGCDGLELLDELRRSGCTVPVLMLTARDTIEDRVQGLDGQACHTEALQRCVRLDRAGRQQTVASRGTFSGGSNCR